MSDFVQTLRAKLVRERERERERYCELMTTECIHNQRDLQKTKKILSVFGS
jgi:hypothetical protein